MESAKTFAEWLFSTTAEIAKLLWAGNRKQIQLDDLKYAMQAVVDNKIITIAEHSLQAALLSTSPFLVQLGWQKLYQKYDLDVTVPSMPWDNDYLERTRGNRYYPMYFKRDLLDHLDTMRLEKELFGCNCRTGSFRNDARAHRNDGWYLVNVGKVPWTSRSIAQNIRSVWLNQIGSERRSGYFATFNHFLIWYAYQKEAFGIEEFLQKKEFLLPCTTSASDSRISSIIEFDASGCQLREPKEFFPLDEPDTQVEMLHFYYGLD